MTQSDRQDLEWGNDADGHSDQSQPIQLPPPQPHQEEINYGDRSWPLYTLYSKVTQEEDNKLVERWQKGLDGFLVFTGLFSATVAALLAVTIPDLKPSSQDTSAFYLENIYQLFANQNTSNGLTPSILAKPTPFSPPQYVVWVNSLWSLALLISLAGAMIVTLGQRWALQYVTHTQNKEYSPETRARFHAKYIKEYGALILNDGPYLFCLHLSLFLFTVGLLIYFFNINRAIFGAVVWLIAITTLYYIFFTLNPLF